MTLPGIGESKAKAILEYREKTGPFAVPQDITNVPGIKEGSYEKLKGYITVWQKCFIKTDEWFDSIDICLGGKEPGCQKKY